jgi:hypothetical protein
MKILTILFLSLFIVNNLYSQGTPVIVDKKDTLKLISGSYEFTQSLPQNSSNQFVDDSNNRVKIDSGNKISVLYEIKDTIYFKYWNFKDDSTSIKEYNSSKIFKVPKNEFTQLTTPLYRIYKGANVGAYSIPFRLRGIGGDNFDFESSLSLQANLVFGFGSQKVKSSWFDASLGIGVTGVNLNNKNSLVTEDRTASALTVSLGALFKPAPFANIGIFLGRDYLGQKDSEVKWVHDGKTWLGLGINVSFNEIKTDNSKKSGNQ